MPSFAARNFSNIQIALIYASLGCDKLPLGLKNLLPADDNLTSAPCRTDVKFLDFLIETLVRDALTTNRIV
jgi:hypothetical protein